MIVSHEVFIWFVTVMAVGICVGWGARDVYLLAKHLPRKSEWSDPDQWRDQIFGSIMGLVIISFGLIGVLKYHLSH